MQDLVISSRRTASLYRFDTIQICHLLLAMTANKTGKKVLAARGFDVTVMRASLLGRFKEYAAGRAETDADPAPSKVFDRCCRSWMSGAVGSYEDGVDRLITAVIELRAEDQIAKAALNASEAETQPYYPADEEDFVRLVEDETMQSDYEWHESRPKRSLAEAFRRGASGSAGDPPVQGRAEDHIYSDSHHPDPPKPKVETQELSKEELDAKRVVRDAQRNLTSLARRGKLPAVYGRDKELERVTEILMRRRKPNVLLVADPGVGKTALAEGLAMHLLASDPIPGLTDRPVRDVSLSSMVSNAKFRGDFEGRMKCLIQEAEKDHAILFIDEFHTIMGAGASGTAGLDGANILKPALSRDGFSVIAATTFKESAHIRQDAALMRRFEVVYLSEPGRADMESILEGAAEAFLAHHHVSIARKEVGKLLDFGERYLENRRNPDRSFDLLDLAAVSARRAGRSMIEMEDLRHAVRRLGGKLPFSSHSTHASKGLEQALCKAVIGYDAQMRTLAGMVSSTSLKAETFKLVRMEGPEGVGKLHAVQTLCEHLSMRLTVMDFNGFGGKGNGPLSDSINTLHHLDALPALALKIPHDVPFKEALRFVEDSLESSGRQMPMVFLLQDSPCEPIQAFGFGSQASLPDLEEDVIRMGAIPKMAGQAFCDQLAEALIAEAEDCGITLGLSAENLSAALQDKTPSSGWVYRDAYLFGISELGKYSS